MNTNLSKAKEILKDGGYTCVLVKDEAVFTSHDRGVKPLIDWLEKGIGINGGSAADKVVGKAAAFLYVLLGIQAVHAVVVSKAAIEVFDRYNIEATYENKVDMIRNRTNTGYCPMEQATLGISTPQEALKAVKETIKKLNR